MPYTLNDTVVPEGMYNRARTVKGNGGKVFLVTPSMPLETDEERAARLAKASEVYCRNCDGCGKLGLEILTGGPYTDATFKKHITPYKESWYAHDIVLFICPTCNGNGLFHRQAARPQALSL